MIDLPRYAALRAAALNPGVEPWRGFNSTLFNAASGSAQSKMSTSAFGVGDHKNVKPYPIIPQP